MAVVATLQVQLDEEVNEQNARLLVAHQNDAAIEDLRKRLKRYQEGLADWAIANPGHFEVSGSLELRQGWLRLRQGQRAIELLKGWTEEMVLARLRRLKVFKAYIRMKEEIDRQGLLRDSKEGPGREIDEKDLRHVGLAVVRELRVHVEPKLEEVRPL